MVEFIGILKVKVIRGSKLAVRDLISSDPYVVLTLGQQVLLLLIDSWLFILVSFRALQLILALLSAESKDFCD